MSNTTNKVSKLPTSSASSVNANRGRTQEKIASMATKSVVDGQRKQTSSPMDQAQRKSSVPAWTKGSTNPLTNRTSGGSSNANGVTNSSNKSSNQKSSSNTSKDSNMSARSNNDRLAFLLQNFKGNQVTLTQRGGTKYTGIFSSSSPDGPDLQYTMKMVKKINLDEGQVNGASEAEAYVGNGPDFTKSFAAKDVVDLQVHQVRFDQAQQKAGQNGASRFKTDTDISGGFAARERQLQRWDAGNDAVGDLSSGLESSAGGTWDQFAANERLFGVKTNYDDKYYTTTIDTSHPDYKKREADADRIAREIVSSTAMNAHVAEERGLKAPEDDGEDEESKYSGVRRDYQPLASGQPDKYTPPARRPPSTQPTSSGPVDPAIISSTLAKPDKSTAPLKENQAAKKPVPSPLAKSPKPDESSKAPAVNAPAKSPLDKVIPSQAKPTSKEGTATATVEKDVVNAFKAFTATEKLRAQEHQRAAAKRDKAVKLNDLKKFAQNFKLHTPVPTDLVPILAKDKKKQDFIVETALKNVEEFKVTPTKPEETANASQSQEVKAAKPAAPRTTSNTVGTAERQTQRPKPSPSNFSQSNRANGNQQIPTMPRPTSHLSQRLGQQYPRQPGMPTMNHLQDTRMPPSGPAMGGGFTSPPGRQLQYTAKMPEFKPNPSAHIFQPTTQASSGSSPVQEQRRPQPGNFFAGRRPILQPGERISITDNFNAIKTALNQPRIYDRKETENLAKKNGGFVRHWTNVVWPVPENNKSYTEILERYSPPSVSPQTHSSNSPMPHQHQLPMHLQSGTPLPQGYTPHQTPRHAPAQPHMTPNGIQYDDHHRMQHSYSSSSVHPSPRAMQPYIASHGQPQQPMPMYQQQVPGYSMSPGGYPMNMRQVSNGQQFISQPGQMGGHMMVSQQSSGPYMNSMNPQVPMYAPAPNQAYAHPNGPMPPQGGSQVFGSPRPAHMMVPQGSQQGHPAMYHPNQPQGGQYIQAPNGPMGPMRPGYGPPQQAYGTSPHQMHHFPQQMRGTPSASYAQPMMQGHSMQPQSMPPNAGPPMPIDGSEDVK